MSARRVRGRGGRRGGVTHNMDTLLHRDLNSYVFALNRNRLMDIFPKVNIQSAHILLELCKGNPIQAIDNILYATELRRSVLSEFAESRRIALAKPFDEQYRPPASQVTSSTTMTPDTVPVKHVAKPQSVTGYMLTPDALSSGGTIAENEPMQQEPATEPENASQFTGSLSDEEALLMNNMKYMNGHVETVEDKLRTRGQQMEHEILNYQILFENDPVPGDVRDEGNEDSLISQMCIPYADAQLVSDQQCGLKIGESTYVVKRFPKNTNELSYLANNPGLLQKFATASTDTQ